jgi:hypothetical protein
MDNRTVSKNNSKEDLIEIQGEALDFLEEEDAMATDNL